MYIYIFSISNACNCDQDVGRGVGGRVKETHGTSSKI